MDVAQMERVMISYVSVEVVVTIVLGVRVLLVSGRRAGTLTRLSIGADLELVNHNDDLYTNPLAASTICRKTFGRRRTRSAIRERCGIAVPSVATRVVIRLGCARRESARGHKT